MQIISIALAFAAVLFCVSAQAEGTDQATCYKAVRAKRPCMATRPNTPAKTNCLTAAMQRYKQGGPGAIENFDGRAKTQRSRSTRVALRGVQCPRCNGHGRLHIIALSQWPTV